MKKTTSPQLSFCLAIISLFACIFLINPSAIADDNKSESPYFIVLSGEDEAAMLPLKSTNVSVNISGVIADVQLNQVYTNAGKTPIEAIYVFPASTRAAVYDMKMIIGDRIIHALIKEKHQARKMYQQAKRSGRTASLLEEKRPNVFKMNVANILPGATVEVNLSYTELLIPQDKIYEFMYPTVVGPRYVSKKESQNNRSQAWNGNPYLKEGVPPSSTLNINVNLKTGIPIKKIKCETHEYNLSYENASNANLELNEPLGGNRDFVMQYRLSGNEIESGILTYKDPEGENYFMAMIQPPERIKAEQIPSREYIFVMDVSGSMRGFPLDISKILITEMLQGLRSKDMFNIVFFAGGSTVFSEQSLAANELNIHDAIQFINDEQGGGGTELINALKTAMNLNTFSDVSRSFVILTDGYVTVEKNAFDYIRNKLGQANFFAFGIGSSVNRLLIEGMAHVGYGEPFIALNKSEAKIQADKFKKYINQPVLTNIEFNFHGFQTYDVQPAHIPDVFAERPIIISGKFKGTASGQLRITGLSGNKSYSGSHQVQSNSTKEGKALKYLWAREKIRLLSDYQNLRFADDTKTEITNLGLSYNLLTEYTSFIAIDTMISNKGGQQQTISQAIPLPDRVGEMTIGAPQTRASALNIVSNDIEMELVDVSNLYFNNVSYDEEEEVEEESTFVIVEKMPSFPGGEGALIKFLKDKVHYPNTAMNLGIQGRVFVQFVIRKNGSISDIRIVRGVHPLLNQEAIRVIKLMPKWTPGMQRGKSVDVQFMLPINFSLDDQVKLAKKVFSKVDKMPEFTGGTNAYSDYLETNRSYPKQARDLGLIGYVHVSFIVLKDGNISKIRLMRGIHPILNKEALRLVKEMPQWQPGVHKGKAVNVQKTIAIKFGDI